MSGMAGFEHVLSTITETAAATVRRQNPARDAMPVPSTSERSLQIAWWNVNRCENGGGSGKDRRCGAASVGGIPAAQG